MDEHEFEIKIDEIVIWKQNIPSVESLGYDDKPKIYDVKVDSILINSIPIEGNFFTESYELYKADISDENLLIVILRGNEIIKNDSTDIYDYYKDSSDSIYDYYTGNKKILKDNKCKKCLDVQGKFLQDNNYVAIIEQDRKKRLKIHSYSIKKTNSIKLLLRHSYVTLDNSGYFYLHPEGKLYYGREGIMQQWNIKDGIFEHEYYFHCPRSFQVRTNKDKNLLAFRDDVYDKKSFSIFSRESDMVFSQHLKFEIEDFEFCKIEGFEKSYLLIIKVTKDGYYLINPYLKDTSPYKVKTIEHNDQQLMIHENLISIVDGKVQIENLLAKETKSILEHIYKHTPTFFLIYITDGITFIDKFKEKKEKWEVKNKNKNLVLTPSKIMHTGQSITWKIELENNDLKLIAKKSQEIDHELDCEVIGDEFSYKFKYSYDSFTLPNDDLVIIESANGVKDSIFDSKTVTIYTIDTKDKIKALYTCVCEKEMPIFNKVTKGYFEFILSSLSYDNMIETTLGRAFIKRIILFYLDNISSFVLYASDILHAAIETNNDEFIEGIIDRSIKYYNENSDSENINILVIITKSLSYLQDSYPYYVNKFLTYTILFRAPHNFNILERNRPHLFGYTVDCHLYKLNFFIKGYLLLSDRMDYINHKFDLINYLRHPKKSIYVLYIPLPQFVSYTSKEQKKFESEFVKMEIADLYSDWNEALINFKWQKAIEYFGVYFAIILNVAKKVFSYLLILFFVIFAYAHAFFTLLQPLKNFDPSTPNFDANDQNSPWNLATTYNSISPDGNTVSKNPSLIQLPNANTNLYEFFGTSLLAVYKLMTGDTGSLALWVFHDNPTLVILWVSFSFFTVIYLLNLFVGLLTNEIQQNNNKSLFLLQRAELIAEIEICCLIPKQKKWRTWFPDHIFYYVHADKLKTKINEIYIKYKDSLYKPYIHPTFLNSGEYDEELLNSTIKTIKSTLLKSKSQETSIFEIKNMEIVEYKKKYKA
ncbi:hypothetical protein C1645_872818 [Glomus cerebriforme]|uniref:Ion transport domain-containing protein n=1 Tax=Glomus cerebriforme TaxID=658196 RepID=A0A397TKK5_9GLOM|nr:hypothetical protein C1645_872818 [Glomus cerebriforme]